MPRVERRQERYATERLLVDEAFARAQWRVGNRFATMFDAAERAVREVTEAVGDGTSGSDLARVMQLADQIEEAAAELICLLSPPEQEEG